MYLWGGGWGGGGSGVGRTIRDNAVRICIKVAEQPLEVSQKRLMVAQLEVQQNLIAKGKERRVRLTVRGVGWVGWGVRTGLQQVHLDGGGARCGSAP
jgi:hypothetical protein